MAIEDNSLGRCIAIASWLASELEFEGADHLTPPRAPKAPTALWDGAIDEDADDAKRR